MPDADDTCHDAEESLQVELELVRSQIEALSQGLQLTTDVGATDSVNLDPSGLEHDHVWSHSELMADLLTRPLPELRYGPKIQRTLPHKRARPTYTCQTGWRRRAAPCNRILQGVDGNSSLESDPQQSPAGGALDAGHSTPAAPSLQARINLHKDLRMLKSMLRHRDSAAAAAARRRSQGQPAEVQQQPHCLDTREEQANFGQQPHSPDMEEVPSLRSPSVEVRESRVPSLPPAEVAAVPQRDLKTESLIADLQRQNSEQSAVVETLMTRLTVLNAECTSKEMELQEVRHEHRTSLKSVSQLEVLQACNEEAQVQEAAAAWAAQREREARCELEVRTQALGAARTAAETSEAAARAAAEAETTLREELHEVRFDAQRSQQANARYSEDLGDRLRYAQASHQNLQNEFDGVQQEVTSLTLARQQLRSELESCEMSRGNLERRLQSAQDQLFDFQTKYDASTSGLRQAQYQGEAMHRELLQARVHAEEADHLADIRQQLKSELLQCQSELAEARKAHQQDSIWVTRLRQENDQLTADCRAAQMLTQSLQHELRGAGERASTQHAENCELRVALETHRMEAERLRETVNQGKRENTMLWQQLQYRPASAPSGLPPGGSAFTGPFPVADAHRQAGAGWTAPAFGSLPGPGGQQTTRSDDAGSSTSSKTPDASCTGAAGEPDRQCSTAVARAESGSPSVARGAMADSATVRFSSAVARAESGSPSANRGFAASGAGAGRPRGSIHAAGMRNTPNKAGMIGATWQNLGSEQQGDSLTGSRRARVQPPEKPPAQEEHVGSLLGSSTASKAVSPSLRTQVPLPKQEARTSSPSVASRTPLKPTDTAGRIMQQGYYQRDHEEQREKQAAVLEKQLMVLNGEKKSLEATLMRFPSNSAGRTIADRRQKFEAEQRIEEVDRTLSEIRMQLRQMEKMK